MRLWGGAGKLFGGNLGCGVVPGSGWHAAREKRIRIDWFWQQFPIGIAQQARILDTPRALADSGVDGGRNIGHSRPGAGPQS
jgi:hypothetical protein